MRFSVRNDLFRRFLKGAHNVVVWWPRNSTLGYIKLTAENGLELVATDLELTFRAHIPAQVQRPGSIAVLGHILISVAREAPSDATLTFTHEPGSDRFELEIENRRFAFFARSAEDFPTIAVEEPIARFTIDAATLVEMFHKTSFVTSGVCLHTAHRKLRAVATDAFQFAMVETSAPANIPPVIVPGKTAKRFKKLFNKVGDTIDVSISPRQIQFHCGPFVAVSKLLESAFPDYERSIPSNEKIALLAVQPLMDAVKRARVVSKLVKLTFERSRPIISSLDSQEDINSLEVNVNARYLLNIMRRINGPKARFELKDGASPIVIRNPDDASTLFVLKPMRV